MGQKYIPPEKMTESELRAELDQSFERWEKISREGGAQTPTGRIGSI